MDRADSLQARLDFSRAVDDSNTLEMAMLQVENEGLRQNQRKWYDELVIMVKVLAFALAAKWLGDG